MGSALSGKNHVHNRYCPTRRSIIGSDARSEASSLVLLWSLPCAIGDGHPVSVEASVGKRGLGATCICQPSRLCGVVIWSSPGQVAEAQAYQGMSMHGVTSSWEARSRLFLGYQMCHIDQLVLSCFDLVVEKPEDGVGIHPEVPYQDGDKGQWDGYSEE